MGHARNRFMAAAGFILIVAVLVGARIFDRNSSTPLADPQSGAFARGPGNLDQPCAGMGVQVDLTKAESDEPYHILVPNTDLAEDSNMTSAWECNGDVVQMFFSSGVKITEEQNVIKDPEAAWQNLAEQDPTTTSVAVVRGQSASLIDPAKDPTGTIAGGVSVVDDGLLLTVGGNGKLSIDDLVKVTESLN